MRVSGLRLALPPLFFAVLFLGTSSTAAVERDTPPFPAPPTGVLHTLLEKTLFQVDVLTLEVRVDSVTADRLQSLARDPDPKSRPLITEAMAKTVIAAPRAWVRMEFHRSVSQGRFFSGIRDNLEKAEKAGIITAEHRARVSGELPEWYGFLAQRGVKSGDVLVYSIHADSLETTYHGVEGTVLFDFAQEDPEARFGVLGSYLAPGSDFREGLLRSILPRP